MTNVVCGRARDVNPLANFIGTWSGEGSIAFTNGITTRIDCRGDYESSSATELHIILHCWTGLFTFRVSSQVRHDNGILTGVWATSNFSGRIRGTMQADRIRVVAESPPYQGLIEIATYGDQQTIRLTSPQIRLADGTIAMSRRAAER